MRVGIDYTSAATQREGIGRVTRELVAALLERSDCPDLRMFYAHRGPIRSADGLVAWDRVRMRRVPVSSRIALAAWFKFRAPIPVEALTGRIDVFHGPDYTVPPALAAPSVVTIHDLSFVRRPQDAHPAQRRFLDRAVPKSINRAALVIAVSESTRDDLIQFYGVPRGRVRVVPNAAPDWYGPVRSTPVLESVRRRLALPERFIFSLGTIQPRKNLPALAAAASRLTPPLPVIHAGREGWLCDRVYREVESAGGEIMRFIGQPDDATVQALFTLAAAFVYPSFAEGFGIPILEAFACECPVVTSIAPGTSEVAGDAALQAAPEDVEALGAAIQRVFDDRTLAADLVRRGLARRAAYSWRSSAARTLGIYREVAGT